MCDCGAYIVLQPSQFYHLCWNNGTCTHIGVEIIALWTFLYFVEWLSIETIVVYEDSKAVIDRANEMHTFNLPMLINWINKIKELIGHFSGMTLIHIYKELNNVDNKLSKKGHIYPRERSISNYKRL